MWLAGHAGGLIYGILFFKYLRSGEIRNPLLSLMPRSRRDGPLGYWVTMASIATLSLTLLALSLAADFRLILDLAK
jgi:hypothetical protein